MGSRGGIARLREWLRLRYSCWVGVIYFGRMIPYLTGGSAAGALD